MKEKLHIAVLSLWICTLIGMSFAISSRDYKEKSPKLNSAPKSTTVTKKFVCSAEAIADSSQATKEYNKNVDKVDKMLVKINNLGGDDIYLEGPCEWLQWKDKTECNINNVELNSLLRQVKKLEEKMIPYEDCIEKLWLLEIDDSDKKNSTASDISIKKCGLIDVTEDVKTGQRKILKCISDAIFECAPASIDFIDPTVDGISTYTVHKKDNGMCSIGVSVDNVDYRCNMPTQLIQDLKKSAQKKNEDLDLIISPIALLISKQWWINPETGKKVTLSCKDHSKEVPKTAKWSEWVWSKCINDKQTRTVECQASGKKVDDKECEWKKPSISKICTDINSSTNANKTSNYKCTDSDNGLSYSKKWFVTEIPEKNSLKNITTTDMCYASMVDMEKDNWITTMLQEYYCDSEGKLAFQNYTCPNGCQDGACINSPKINTTKCIDSDGGYNIYVKWTASMGQVSKVETCTKKTGDALSGENYTEVAECSGNNCYVWEVICSIDSMAQFWPNEENKCQFGCSNGACKKS